ncbi:MAG: hypothetical protein R6W90_02340 [Ignavibacteriaceae bacterium]
MSKNKDFTETEIIEQINLIHNLFVESRAAFPYYSLDGQPPLISGSRTSIFIHPPTPMTNNDKIYRNNIAHFQNQNFLVRLFAVLQYHGVYNNFDKSLPGATGLDILKRLRNEFGHGLGLYNPKNQRDRKLMKDIIDHFTFEKKGYLDYPLNKDILIKGIISESKIYIKELSKKPKPKISFFTKYVYLPLKSFLVFFRTGYTHFK